VSEQRRGGDGIVAALEWRRGRALQVLHDQADPGPPTRVIACESSCTTIRADDKGMIEVLFVCDEQKRPVK
jgi:hypothetical protein